MKFILPVFLLLISSGFSLGQTLPIAKTYQYFSQKEEWQLKIVDFKTVDLWVRRNNENYFLAVEGKCVLTDSTICFVFDSCITIDMILNDTSCGANVKEFIKGKSFKRENDYIIPNNYTTENNTSPFLKTYFQQVELNMGGTKVELKNKNQYTITQYSCKGHWIEKGKYIQLGNTLTLKSDKKSTSFSGFLMDGSSIYKAEHFLISKKLQATTQPEKYSQEEVFLYFLQQ